MEQKNDEIDLLALTQNMMVGFYHYVLRRYKLFGIALIIGAVIGIGFYLKDKNTYESTIIGTSYVVSPVVVVDILNSLQEINKTDKEAIMEFLKLNQEDAEALLMIEADTIQSIRTIDQTITTIQIKVKFKEDFNFAGFSKKLSDYIDSNIYVAKELKLEKLRSLNIIKKYEEEIKNLDSLQKNILSSSLETSNSQPGNLLILNDKSNSIFHDDIITLEGRKSNELKKMERLAALTVIDEKRGIKTKEVSLIGTVATMMAVFFGIGFFISLILEFKRQVQAIENKK